MKYQHIFFDLDHTLWDFEKNSAESLKEIANIHALSSKKIPVEEFIHCYHIINDQLWGKYRKDLIDKETLRKQRFYEALKKFKIDDPILADSLNNAYIQITSSKTNLLPFAHEILTYLKEKYELHIITNGFNETQYKKLNNCGLQGYFSKIITSEDAGHNKPKREMFEFSLKIAGAKRQKSLMIGDHIDVDILGARRAGIDQVYFNPRKLPHREKITYEIYSLDQLRNFL